MAAGQTPAVAPTDWQDVKPQQPTDWQDVAVPADTTQKAPNSSSAAVFGADGKESPTPGFFSRLKDAMGIPTSLDDLKAMRPGMSPASGWPGVRDALINSAAGPAAPAVHNVIDQGKQLMTNLHAGAAPSAEIPKFLLKGPLAPFGGGAVNNFAEDVGGHMNASPGHPFRAAMHGDVAGDVLGGALNLALMKASNGLSADDRLNSLTFAGGPKTAIPLEHVLQPFLETAEAAGIKNPSVADVLKIGNKFKDRINTDYGNAIGPYASQPFYPVDAGGNAVIPARIRALKDKFTDIDADGRQAQNIIERAAQDYDKPLALGKLDRQRTLLDTELAKLSDKTPSARYTAKNGNVNTLIDSTIRDAIRDTVYPKADQLAGKPSGYFENLKQQQSHAIRLQGLLESRVDDLIGKSRYAKGQPTMSRLRPGAAISGEGVPHGYVSNVVNAISPKDVLKQANNAAAKGMSTGGVVAPVSKALVMSYPARWALMQPPMVADPNAPPQ